MLCDICFIEQKVLTSGSRAAVYATHRIGFLLIKCFEPDLCVFQAESVQWLQSAIVLNKLLSLH